MGKLETTAAREARKIKARRLSAAEAAEKRTPAKRSQKLVESPRGYVFALVVKGGSACLMEIGKASTLCGQRSEAMRFAPRRAEGSRPCRKCQKVWAGRERYGHPDGLEEKAQALEEFHAQRIADAAATEG